MTSYTVKDAKTILRKGKATDSWFISRYGMNLYRGCEHACAYCDGRAEKYRVEGEFGAEIQIKSNAPTLLKKALGRLKEKGFIFLGGGVSDAYQPAERQHGLAQSALEIIRDHKRPVHVLTKSALVERDLDLIGAIARTEGAVLSFSFCSSDEELVEIFEPGSASVAERLRILQAAKERGIATGIMLMPVLPFISDATESLENMARLARDGSVDFVLMGGLTLKPGRQREHFYRTLEEHAPHLVSRYRSLYAENKWGNADARYYDEINKRFYGVIRKYRIAPQMPHRLYKNRIELNAEVSIALQHLHHILWLQGKKRDAYERVAWKIMFMKESIADLARSNRLKEIPGVGEVIERIVQEIVFDRKCAYLEKLLGGNK